MHALCDLNLIVKEIKKNFYNPSQKFTIPMQICAKSSNKKNDIIKISLGGPPKNKYGMKLIGKGGL